MLNFRYRVAARRGRITGTIRQEHAIRIALQDILGFGGRRDDRDAAARRCETTQYVAFQPIIDRNDMEFGPFLTKIPLAPRPTSLVPSIALPTRYFWDEVHAN